MSRQRTWLIAVVLALLGATAFAGPRLWRWYNAPPAGHCHVCLRHEHKESLVRFQAEGEPVTNACCLSCALTYGRQLHKAVKIVAVTDHDTGASLDPSAAAFVVGSDVSPCTHAMMHLGPEKEEYPVHWDRCLPSIIAFRSADVAEQFRAQHGGRVRSLAELVEKAARSEAPLD